MWEELNLSGALPDVRSQHTAVWSHEADGMYVFGGYDGQGPKNAFGSSRPGGYNAVCGVPAEVLEHTSMTCGSTGVRRVRVIASPVNSSTG